MMGNMRKLGLLGILMEMSIVERSMGWEEMVEGFM